MQNKDKTQKKDNEHETKTWKYAIDKVLDFISSSKSTLQILNEKQAITDDRKAEAARQNAKEVIRGRILKELLKTDNSEGDRLTELHVNESFNETTESNVRCSADFSDAKFGRNKEPVKQQHTSMNFLDEQYNLTKQAIARRYRPQMRINTMTTKNNAMRDLLCEPFNDELHRISIVASEKIPVDQVKKKHIKKSEKNCNVEAPSNKETFVIYEKY